MDKKTENLIRAALRGSSLRWHIRNEVLNDAKVYIRIVNRDGRTSKRKGVLFICAACFKQFKRQSVEVDHISPVGGLKQGWSAYIERLFCDEGNLQVLCKRCHKNKTKKQGKAANSGGGEVNFLDIL